jgi:hypothetical protein
MNNMQENKQTLYKVLVNGKSCHGGDMEWKLNVWNEVKSDELKMCETGIHLTTKPANWWKLNWEVYEAEAEGIKEWKDDKCVAKRARITRKLTSKELDTIVPYQSRLNEFITKEIPNTKFFKPDGKPKKEWKVFYGDTWDAARDAARGAARDAAWGAARDAAWGAARDAARGAARGAARDAAWGAARDAAWDATWSAARDTARGAARGAARDAAWGAARDAAWDAAWGAARDAARGAARDAALYSDYIITADLKFKDKEKHAAHAKARWEVWQKGYGLLCDVDGVLYVYAVKPKKPNQPR